ncbi:MAG TPA: DUF2231 domain-containing protein [Candidatus Kapabacteria bacterium]|nr:DUF2231 domain-containing protein [Candidatus Kapabacteria bacterium]
MGDLHNIINHFTVALLNLGILFELLGYRSSSENMRTFGWTALRMSLGFAILSLITGYITEGSLHAMVEEAKPVNAYHKAAAFGTLALLAASVITRMSAKEKFFDVFRGASIRAVYFTLLAITFVLGSITGYLGMELTYSYGVNVEPYERIIESLPPRSPTADQPTLQLPPTDTFQTLPNATAPSDTTSH